VGYEGLQFLFIDQQLSPSQDQADIASAKSKIIVHADQRRFFSCYFLAQESSQYLINTRLMIYNNDKSMSITSLSIGLSLLSSNMSKEAKRKELLSAEGRRILSILTARPLTDGDIMREESGRPYFPDCEEDFNISHSGAATAVSLVKGKTLRTGCDIQLVQTRVNTMRIAKEFFSPTEREYISFSDGNRHRETKFFEIWVLKESFLKLRGLSVFDMAKAPSFISCDNLEKWHFAIGATVSSPLSFYLYELSGGPSEQYMLAVAVQGTKQLRPVMQWFSQSSLSYRNIAEIKAPV